MYKYERRSEIINETLFFNKWKNSAIVRYDTIVDINNYYKWDNIEFIIKEEIFCILQIKTDLKNNKFYLNV